MDFKDSPEQAAFREKARHWLEAQTADIDTAARDERSQVTAARDWQQRKAEHGWSCLSWPAEYGGRGSSPIEDVIFQQEEDRLGFTALSAWHIISTGMAGPTIMAHGCDTQKTQQLPKIITGDRIWCQLFSEAGAGSDLAGVQTRAVREGDHWRVDGQKVWTTYAQHADWGILVARTDPGVPKHRGLSYFMVDMRAPGIEVRPIRQAPGDCEFNEVFFSDLHIPDSNRLGEVGDGWRVAMTTLMSERIAVGASFPDHVDDILALATSTRWGEQTALDNAAVRQGIADWYVQAAGVKATQLRILTDLCKGKNPGPEASITKLVLGRGRQDLAAFALDLMGPAGVLDGADACGWGHYDFFRTIGNRLEGGTDEILRNIIGERVLGLPPEPRIDKDLPFNQLKR